MKALAIILLSLTSVAASVLVSPEVYYNCEMYPAGTTYQEIDKTRRECIMENVDGADRLFCKHWQCETPQCAEQDQVTWPDGCNACPGMCSSGGKFHQLGTGFTCPDNVNHCGCSETGGYFSTFIGYDRFALCNAPIV
uniref:Uncharacterized protein LOC111104804 n=1 Tax=Crassostrea virginica TaxID=6565 RepID=A0A8B8AVD7_CRAVI|nr:uncharacterized protein LOC111104804 [Crassostrea virginica]|mmetsp:Transcript_32406/g.51634  ORF Transcript_32406/g.51634 Transcript_32406/m.51634 type:complete len:138 (-) Transcript_32406:8-421(-)